MTQARPIKVKSHNEKEFPTKSQKNASHPTEDQNIIKQDIFSRKILLPVLASYSLWKKPEKKLENT